MTDAQPMLYLIDDAGARAETASTGVVAAPHDDEAAALEISRVAAAVSIPFPSFADGRGFSVAMRLRAAGFAGRLRAEGHLIPDQYAYARSCGFDEVALSPALFERTGATAWADAGAAATPPFHRRRRAAG